MTPTVAESRGSEPLVRRQAAGPAASEERPGNAAAAPACEFGRQPLYAIEVIDDPEPDPALLRGLYRAAEFAAAFVALILTAPVMLVIAVLIKLDSPGPVLFFHTRVGRSRIARGSELIGRTDIRPESGEFDPGKRYWVPTTMRFVKFRTMYRDAAQRFPDLYRFNFRTREEFLHAYYKVEDDPRVTRIGKKLRQLTLDELPNFWIVLTGKAGLVGPRPEGPYFVPYYTAEEMRKFTVRSGITGLAQINGRGNITIGDHLYWDLRYVRERSVALDVKVVLRTLWLVLSRRGAF